ncbi:MAG: hypothetical protein V1763_01295 [Parcubacteria group bacterium]
MKGGKIMSHCVVASVILDSLPDIGEVARTVLDQHGSWIVPVSVVAVAMPAIVVGSCVFVATLPLRASIWALGRVIAATIPDPDIDYDDR